MDSNKQTNEVAIFRQQQITKKQEDDKLKIIAIQTSLIFVMKRLDDKTLDIKLTTEAIFETFSRMPLENIKLAIKNGSTGKYGRTYKLTTQEVCYWIREFIEEDVKSREL
jgi:hypothetical protein